MSTLDQTEILWNKYNNVPDAYPSSSFLANQAVGDAFLQIVPDSQLWTSDIPATAPADLGSAVSITNGSYQQSASYSWIRKYTITMGAIQAAGISYWYASTDVNNPLTTNVGRDTIPFNFDPVGSYNIQVFANGTPVSPNYTPYPWNYDFTAGVLTFYPASFAVLPPTPITMVYWRYVGTKGGTSANSANTIVARDATNNFSAGTITANLTGTASTGTQVIQTLFNPLMITNRILYPAFWFNSLTGGSKALYGDNSINSLLTIRFETGGSGDPVFYTPNINNLGTITTTTITAGGSIGTSGQYLSSTGSALSWITPPTIPTVNNGTLTITNGTFMTGSGTFTANQAGNTSITIGTNATSASTASTIVARDASQNFSANIITANLTGTATTANNVATTITTATVYPTFVANNTASSSTPLLIDGGISYNATTNVLTAIGGFAGTASSASAITTTTAGVGTFYPVFTTAGTGGTFRVLSVDVGLSYVASSDTLTCGTFVGALTGTATTANNVATTAATTGTFYPTFVPLSTTQPSQALNVKSSMFYVANLDQLNLGTITGYPSSANLHLALLDNTTAAGAYNNIQLGISNNTNASWFIGAQNDTGPLGLFSIAPYGTAQDACFFITNSGITSSPVVEGRNCLQTYDRTVGTGSFTLYYTDSYKVDVEVSGSVQTRIWSNAIAGYPIADGYTGLQIGNGTNGTQLIFEDTTTNKNAITNQSGNLRFWNDANDPTNVSSLWGYVYQQTKYGENTWYLNPSLGILLDAPVMNVDNVPLLYSSGLTQTLNNFVSIALTSLANNIYTLTVKVNGNNPFGRTITILTQYAFNFKITAVAGATFPTAQSIQPLSSTQSATINGSAFTGYVFSQTGVLTAYTYNQSAISSWTIFQPVGQVQWVITPTNTGNDIDTYVFTIDLNRSVPAAATGITYSASGVYDNSFITLAGTINTESFVRNTGTGTLTTTLTPTTNLLTTTKSGATGLLTLNNAVDVEATRTVRVENTLQTTGTQFLTMVGASGTNTTTGQIVGTHAPLSYNVASSTLYSPNMNVVYYNTVSATTGTAYVPNIFTSTYTDYEIFITFASPVLTGVALSFDLITGASTRLASGWDTLTSYVNGTAMVSLTPPASLCYITTLPNSSHIFKYKCVMTNPRSVVRAKQFIAGLNVGYLTASTQTTYTSSGYNSSTVSQTGFALIITGGGSWTADVLVRGMNN